MAAILSRSQCVNSLRSRQNGRLFADDTFKHIFLNENIRISTTNSLNFVPKGLINNIPALVLIMAWRRPGDKPLSEPMLVRSLTHICVTRPQCVKSHLSLIQNMDLLFTNICCHSNGYAYHDDRLREFPHTFVPISVSNISFIIWIFIRRWANMTSGQIMVKSHVHVRALYVLLTLCAGNPRRSVMQN